MERSFRQAYNAAYSPQHYRNYLHAVESQLGMAIPFRVAETPLFLPKSLRTKLVTAATEIVEQLSRPGLIERCTRAVPPEYDVPRRDALPNCVQVDLAITQGSDGELDVKLVELQGFPSLYVLTVLQAEALAAELHTMPGLARPWTCLFQDKDRGSYLARLKRALLAGHAPEDVILMDLDPPAQKTYPDMLATQRLLGIDPVCPTKLERDGRRLYRRVNGRRVQVRRIYNRVVFDELLKTGARLPFHYTEDLDVSWCPHPNWYWVWSKYTIPFLQHPAVPRSRFLSEVTELPPDLENYVLKPLFSFAGSGVKIDVTRADIDAIPWDQRYGWLLQERIHYAAALPTPEGHGVKAEVRMMFLRAPDQGRPELVLNLVRLSRGRMHGVDHNKDLDWVGGTVGLWPADEA